MAILATVKKMGIDIPETYIRASYQQIIKVKRVSESFDEDGNIILTETTAFEIHFTEEQIKNDETFTRTRCFDGVPDENLYLQSYNYLKSIYPDAVDC